MRRIQGDTVEADKFGAGKHGFSEGNAETQRPATIVTGSWFDQVQEELVRAIEASGQTPDGANLSQLAQAIAAAAASGPPGTDPTTLLARINAWTAAQQFDSGLTVGMDQNLRASGIRRRTKNIPLSAVKANVASGAFHAILDDGLRSYGGVVTYAVDLDAFLPPTCTIVEIRAGVLATGVAGGNPASMTLKRLTHVKTTADGGANALLTAFTKSVTKAGSNILSSGLINAPVNDLRTLRLEFGMNILATAGDSEYVRWIEVGYEGLFGIEYL